MPETILNADHIAAQSGGFEPQRKNNFNLRLVVGGEIIQQALQSFPLPQEASEVIRINRNNRKSKVSGIVDYDDLTLVLKDYADKPVMAKLLEWRRKVWDPKEEKIGLPSKYRCNGDVVMSAPDGTSVRRWELKGVWPSKVNPGGGDMESNTQNLITVTLVVEKAYEVEV